VKKEKEDRSQNEYVSRNIADSVELIWY